MSDDNPGSMTLLLDDLGSPVEAVRDEAALRIWERYGPKLLALVRARLDRRLLARVDEEDVAQSAYLSFCMGQGAESSPTDREQLWKFLARISTRKICNAANHHRALRRDYRREASQTPARGEGLGAELWILEHLDRGAPGPDEAAVVAELIDSLPDEELRRIAFWKLEGLTNEEVAERIGRTVRSVEIKMQRIRKHLKRQPGG
jgi:RNA polymerase sigma factor (sigma-70 family)